MSAPEAVFLGILQGITEFLPVSSSGHLVLAEYFLGLTQTSIAFDVTLHLGTLLAVLSYFRKDWINMALSVFAHGEQVGDQRRLLLLLMAGTVPGAAFGYLFEDAASTVFRSPWLVVGTLSGVALLLLLAEKTAKHKRSMEDVGLKDAVSIGLAQALAIVPGVSRSGITMTVGMFLGLRRVAAARFSFLLSAPIIAGAGLYEVLKLLHGGFDGFGPEYVWGFAASAISGYVVIAFLMRFLADHTFIPFVYYRLVLAACVAAALNL